MYPLGVLFGLGFDTSSEIALLGISSIQAAQETSVWLMLIFPILFTGKQRFPALPVYVPQIPFPGKQRAPVPVHWFN
jgi:hypothetical protein